MDTISGNIHSDNSTHSMIRIAKLDPCGFFLRMNPIMQITNPVQNINAPGKSESMPQRLYKMGVSRKAMMPNPMMKNEAVISLPYFATSLFINQS